jgi:hypothetical protein
MSDSITCPKCKTEIPLSDAIGHEVEERLRAEFEAEKARLVAEQAQQLAEKDMELDAAVVTTRQEVAAVAEAKAAERMATHDFATSKRTSPSKRHSAVRRRSVNSR